MGQHDMTGSEGNPLDNNVKSKVDWATLEDMEFSKFADMWDWCKDGVILSRDTFDVIDRAEREIALFVAYNAMGTPRQKGSKAKKATKKLKEMKNHLEAVRVCFNKLPTDIKDALSEELEAMRYKKTGKSRKLEL